MNTSKFNNSAYKLYKMANNGRGPNRATVIERGTVARNAIKIFHERFQKGDYYVELEYNRGRYGVANVKDLDLLTSLEDNIIAQIK